MHLQTLTVPDGKVQGVWNAQHEHTSTLKLEFVLPRTHFVELLQKLMETVLLATQDLNFRRVNVPKQKITMLRQIHYVPSGWMRNVFVVQIEVILIKMADAPQLTHTVRLLIKIQACAWAVMLDMKYQMESVW